MPVNNGAESRQQITSTEHDDRYQFYKRCFYANKHGIQNENSQHTYETPQFEDNDTIHQYETIQYEDEIEEIILPIPTQFQDNEYEYEYGIQHQHDQHTYDTQFDTIHQYETIQYEDEIQQSNNMKPSNIKIQKKLQIVQMIQIYIIYIYIYIYMIWNIS